MERVFTVRISVDEEHARNDAEFYSYGKDITALLEGEILSHLHSLDYVQEVAVGQVEQ